jgi:uncharacterized membrane protein YfcA
MELIGFVAALFVGLSLGLLGGGGSILTVPLLVYVFHIPPAIATAYSLLIVGTSSLVGSVPYLVQGLASPKTALFFSFPSFLMVFITRKFVLPLIPNEVFSIGNFTLTKSTMIMCVFAVLMLLASKSMIWGRREGNDDIKAIRQKLNYPVIFIEGLLVGFITGFVGVGGGFLIIPVLTNFVKLPMKLAVGTSLMIIAINSLFGYLGDIGQHTTDWVFVGRMVAMSVTGVLVGSYLSKFIKSSQLKPIFGVFLLCLGVFILVKEIYLK